MALQEYLWTALTGLGLYFLCQTISIVSVKLDGWAQKVFYGIVTFIVVSLGQEALLALPLSLYLLIRPFVFLIVCAFVVTKIGAYLVQTNQDRARTPVSVIVILGCQLGLAIIMI